MISSPSASRSEDDDDDVVPTGTPALPSSSAASEGSSRVFPPRCWTDEEIEVLIDVYKNKWYSLRQRNLSPRQWQEVADDVQSRCSSNQPKTFIQCLDKMQSLRKKYRAAISRGLTRPWMHFGRMDEMEKGLPPPAPWSSDDEDQDRVPIDQEPEIRVKIPGELNPRPTKRKSTGSEATKRARRSCRPPPESADET